MLNTPSSVMEAIDRMLTAKKVLTLGATALSAAALTAAAFAAPASAAPSPGVCSGGSILAGTYASLTVNGPCKIDKGTVNVTGDVTVKPGNALFADYGGSDLHVKGNVTVNAGAVVTLGCAPTDRPCFNDPQPAHPTFATHHSIGGKFTANKAFTVSVNNSNVKGDMVYDGGGVIGECLHDLTDVSNPAASLIEDNNFGAAVTIKGVGTTCWMGFLGNHVVGTVTYNNNAGIASSNVIDGNQIGGDLRCQGNTPAPQAATPSTGPNLVAGTRTGQCQSTSLP